MFKRVIAGFDGYDGGRDALVLAKALHPERLIVLMAYGGRTVISPTAAITYWDDLRDEARQRIASACLELGVDAHEQVIADTSAARALHDAAVQHDADLLVIGSAHLGRVGRLLLGDVGTAVLQDAPCAVAIAPKRLRDAGWAPRRIGVAFDGSDEAWAALRTAERLAAEHGGTLVVLTAWESPLVDAAAYEPDVLHLQAETEQRAREVLDGALAATSGGAEGRLLQGRAPHVLTEASERLDLLVAGSRGWGSAGRLILGSTSHHLARHAACPLVVLPRPVVTAGA